MPVTDPKAALAQRCARRHIACGIEDTTELAKLVVEDLIADGLVSDAERPNWERKVEADLLIALLDK